MIAHNPLHGSGQAEFPHPALALGEDARAMQGIGMTDGRDRLPFSTFGHSNSGTPYSSPHQAARHLVISRLEYLSSFSEV